MSWVRMLANPGTKRRMARRIWHLLSTAIVIAGTAEVVTQPPTLGGRDPSDPSHRVPPITHRPVTSGLRSFRPVEPLPWGGQNQKVTPKPKAGEESPASRQ
jgi:hypothetical protein